MAPCLVRGGGGNVRSTGALDGTSAPRGAKVARAASARTAVAPAGTTRGAMVRFTMAGAGTAGFSVAPAALTRAVVLERPAGKCVPRKGPK